MTFPIILKKHQGGLNKHASNDVILKGSILPSFADKDVPVTSLNAWLLLLEVRVQTYREHMILRLYVQYSHTHIHSCSILNYKLVYPTKRKKKFEIKKH